MWSCDFPEVLHRTTKCYFLRQDLNIQSHLTNWTNYWSVTGWSLVVWCLWMVILVIEPSFPATWAQKEWRTVHQEGQQGRLFGLASLARELGLQKAQSHCPVLSPKSLKTSHTHTHTHTHTHSHRDMIPLEVRTTSDNDRYLEQGQPTIRGMPEGPSSRATGPNCRADPDIGRCENSISDFNLFLPGIWLNPDQCTKQSSYQKLIGKIWVQISVAPFPLWHINIFWDVSSKVHGPSEV